MVRSANIRSRVRSGSRTAVALSALLFLASCATQPEALASDVPGFLSGLWHGFTILFSLIGSFFTDVRIYAFPNAGVSYDIGFAIGAGVFFSAAS